MQACTYRAGLLCFAASLGVTLSGPASGAHRATPHVLQLRGSATGAYRIVPGIPDTGRRYDLAGAGRIEPLGNARVRGSLVTTGFIAEGRARGRLVLSS